MASGDTFWTPSFGTSVFQVTEIWRFRRQRTWSRSALLVLSCGQRKNEPPNPREFERRQTFKADVLLYPVLLNFRKSISLCKVSRLRPFVFLVTATCARMWVWSICGMILTVENRNTRRRTCPSANFSTKVLTRTELGSNPGLVGETPATDSLDPGTVCKERRIVCTTIWTFGSYITEYPV
jgi:hypothetical protein